MAKKYLDDEGLRYLWTKIKNKYATQEDLEEKVDKETGKGLSSNDFTDTLKNKLDGIAAGAEVNVQANWSETDSASDAFIKNKPSIPGATSTTPKMDGTAAVGTENKWAKGDHVHPSDTSRVPTTRKVNGKALSADIELKSDDIGLSGDNAQSVTDAINRRLELRRVNSDGGVNRLQVMAYPTTPLESGGAYSTNIYTLDAVDSLFAQAGVALNGKVDKVEGKGLSTNDYTDAEKTKLAGIATGAEVNVLEGVQVNGTDLTITDKKVNVPVFTGATTSENGAVGLVPQPSKKNDTTSLRWSVLSSDGQWNSVSFSPLLDTTGVGVRLGIGSSSTSAYITKATTEYDGVMSSTDKTKLDKLVFDGSNKIDSSILPSFVDDVIEAYPVSGATELSAGWLSETSGGAAFTPTSGKIYVLLADTTNYATNTQFRWATNTYVKLNDGGVSSITNAEIDTIVAS